jgi:hypothetical protein
MSTPTTEPTSITAGDTAIWRKTLADYPASQGWTLSYALVRAGAAPIIVTSAAEGDDHVVTITSATSANWSAVNHDWQSYVTKAAERYTIARGRLSVLPNFAAVGGAGLDARSQARKTLEAINATLEGRASSSTQEYQIAGRALKYIPIPELLQLKSHYETMVRSEDAAANMANGLGGGGRIYVRF